MNFLELVPMIAQGGRNMPKTILRSSWALALLAGLLAPGAFAAQTSGASNGLAMALHDGVVVDAAAGAAYVMSPRGGIDAIDLTSGNVMWKSRDAAKPLLVKGGTLLAQAQPDRAGKLAVVALDAKRGSATRRIDLDIPSGVRAQVFDGPSQTFKVEAFSAANGMIVAWTAEDGRSLQGLLPPEPEGSPAESKAAVRVTAEPRRGAARLDLAAGRALPMAYEKALGLRTPDVAEKSRASSDPSRLTSLDGRHVLHSEPSAEGNLLTAYRWTLTNAAGKRIGTVDAPVGMAPFVVSGSRVLYVAQPSAYKVEGKMVQQPLRLVALDLKTGGELWSAMLTDSAYRGPFPP
jgi:hypothetical protein